MTYTDLNDWLNAVSGTASLEDFEGATEDVYFGLAGNATTSPNGSLGLSANANFDDNASIDVSPYVSSGADINGDVVVNMRFLDGGHGSNAQETVTVALPAGVVAFAFEYNNYDSGDDGAFLSFEGTNGQIVGAFDSTVDGFFGVLDTDPGAVISSFSFTGDPAVGTGVSAFNSFDDVRYSVVPEPTTSVLLGLAAIGLGLTKRRPRALVAA
ncbi:PEP-CTERM sorting domain-containing protein [Pseudobythopirellula maris]|nr:PEP-CTERM sorting domain-containing protein [Pseudobythopirellula maris]